MQANNVVAIRSVEFGVTDLARSTQFYDEVFALPLVTRSAERSLLRATGPEHHVLQLRPAEQAGLLGVDFAAPEAAAVTRLHDAARAAGHRVLAPPHERAAALGGGFGLDLASPDGLRIGVTAGGATHAPEADKTRPTKLTHVVANSADPAQQVAWFIDFLGFRLSDQTRTQTFLRCGPDHHAMAFGRSTGASLNHAAFEMVDIDGLMYGAGRMIDHGFEVEWGLGRHGPGQNVFSYFVDPDGYAIEYTTEVEQVDEQTYVVHDPVYWTEFPSRPCRWGVARKPSERLTQAFAGQGLTTRAKAG